MTGPTHDPSLRSWVESANDPGTDFPVQNLPLVTYEPEAGRPASLGCAIGDQIFDVSRSLGVESMRTFLAMPHARRIEFRQALSEALVRRSNGAERLLTPAAAARLLIPCEIGDYTDFYASIHHATNVGSMFRPENPLLPNYKWLPVAYHGRASSIVVSGTAVRRPKGQIAQAQGGPPEYRPTGRLDYELELAALLGPGNAMGEPVPVDAAADHIAGVCLLNDWSARDIQTWEYQPLGPFLAKNFATSISPWVVTAEALEPFRVDPPQRPESDPPPLAHLRNPGRDAYDITLEVWLRTAAMRDPVMISRGNFACMYWTLAQMVAHHTSNGCSLRPGDVIASGTVSGPEKQSRGCLLELTWRGAEPLSLPAGQSRTFLEDGDEVIMRGWCQRPGFRRIGLGECRGVVLPASSH